MTTTSTVAEWRAKRSSSCLSQYARPSGVVHCIRSLIISISSCGSSELITELVTHLRRGRGGSQ